MRADTPFWPPVNILFGHHVGVVRSVTSVREACQCLASDKWPNQSDPASLGAVMVFIDAAKGQATAEDARAAFEEAARKAGVLIEVAAERH